MSDMVLPRELVWPSKNGGATLHLPRPRLENAAPLQRALAERRSVRSYTREPLSLAEVAALLWAAQGVSDVGFGHRTAPSAGALYPLEAHLVAGDVTGLEPGVYTYASGRHELSRRRRGDARAALCAAAWHQPFVDSAPVVLALTAVYARTTEKYGERRGSRYVHIEAGHAAQNAALLATALGLGTTVVGSFEDERVASALELGADESPLVLLPVGRPSNALWDRP
jgi:SagB-type dehydrogenase family enzyme